MTCRRRYIEYGLKSESHRNAIALGKFQAQVAHMEASSTCQSDTVIRES